jgi:hypothetical protein
MTADENYAIHQLIGFKHAKEGHTLIQLIDGMGLTLNEFHNIEDDPSLSDSDKMEIRNHLQSLNTAI